MKKAILIILDSLGIGALPDAHEFDDSTCNTLKHIMQFYHTNRLTFSLPNLASLGLFNLIDFPPLKEKHIPILPGSSYGRLIEQSHGKDTVTGHWEMAGIITKEPFPVFPNGFPVEMLDAFERTCGTKVLGNIAASGTAIIEQFWPEHLATKQPILYTSADSVWQIAAHEDIIPLDMLYHYCQMARKLFMTPPYNVGRIIARPFIGEPGNFIRTANRRDYAIQPSKENLLCDVVHAHQDVMALGKISDIFADTCITQSIHTNSNDDGLQRLLTSYSKMQNGLLFLNLVDFDAKYGHRRDPYGYGQALMDFDQILHDILAMIDNETLLIISADHGCDPTASGSDHTREYVPVLMYQKGTEHIKAMTDSLGFDCIGATIAQYLSVMYSGSGQNLLMNL